VNRAGSVLRTDDGLALHVSGDGPAVLWLHGYTMDSTTWRALWDELPGWRHIGVDLPGHGRSAPLVPGQTLPEVADRVAAIAAAHHATDVVALSFGSTVALQLAIDHPDQVSRLVLGAPTISGALPQTAADDRYRQLMMMRRMGRATGFAGLPAMLADLWMQSPPDIFRGTLKHPGVRAALRDVIIGHSWEELDTGAMRGLTEHDQTPGLSRITADTLVFNGDEDMPSFQDNARLLADTLERCRVVDLAGAGHLCLLERPADVATALAAHLR
jgi:pimeloyl-ACP methyl ester carboxylesterase